MSDRPSRLGRFFEQIRRELSEAGIAFSVDDDFEAICEEMTGGGIKLVCVAPGLRDSVEEMGKSPRDKVVMVRVDKETATALDAWVETGAVKSRSEAAALFIREGLKLRADELDRLKDALSDLESARERVRREAREIFGNGDGGSGAGEPSA